MAILVQYIDRRVKFLLPRRRLAKIRLIFRLLRPLYTSFLFDPDSPTSFFRLRPTRASLLGFPWNAPKLAAPLCLLSSLRAVKHLRLLRFLSFFPASFDSFRRHERRNSSPVLNSNPPSPPLFPTVQPRTSRDTISFFARKRNGDREIVQVF